MSQLDPNRRFQIAYDRARSDWAAAVPARCAALAGCEATPDGIVVPFFKRAHLVPHPEGNITALAGGKAAHPSIAIVLLHYLLKANGTQPADRWLTFRELPDGLFYAQAFAGHAESLLAQRFGADVEGYRRAASALGGAALGAGPGAGLAPPDAAFYFQAFPRISVIVQMWAGDEEFPGRAQILFDAHAGHYLPTEDLAGVGDWLAHHMVTG